MSSGDEEGWRELERLEVAFRLDYEAIIDPSKPEGAKRNLRLGMTTCASIEACCKDMKTFILPHILYDHPKLVITKLKVIYDDPDDWERQIAVVKREFPESEFPCVEVSAHPD